MVASQPRAAGPQTAAPARTGHAQGVRTRPDPRTSDPSDAERFAHYIADWDGRGRAQAMVTEAQVLGTPLEALCGKKWIPSRDPKRFPVCPECKELAAMLRGE